MTELSIIVIREGDLYVAQALEHDITGQGETIGEAVEALGLCIRGHEQLGSLERVPRAPLAVWDRATYQR